MARILVTGGSGFVGSNLVNRLLLENHHVVSVDDYSNGLKDNDTPGVKYLKFDISNKENWQELNGVEIDAVYHLAAQSSNAISFQDPERDLLVNQLGTLNVLEYCRINRIRRLIFTSSMSVYGNPENFPTSPKEPPRPETYYAIHKAASEDYIQISKNIDWTILRLYTTYGAGQNLANREQGLVKIFLGYILRGEPIKVHGPLERIRDIIHVSDAVEALTKCLHRKEAIGKIYNLASGQTISVKNLIEKIIIDFGESVDYPIEIEDWDSGDPFKTHADISLTKRDLDWIPKVGPLDGIEMTMRSYKNGK